MIFIIMWTVKSKIQLTSYISCCYQIVTKIYEYWKIKIKKNESKSTTHNYRHGLLNPWSPPCENRWKLILWLSVEWGMTEIFGLKIMVLPWTTFLISNGNNIVPWNFACFAAADVTGWEFATGNRASCPWQKTWSSNFSCALLNW